MELPDAWKPFARTSRRIVCLHPNGMMQIIGHSDTQPPDMLHPYGVPVNLVAVKRSYYLYKPVMAPGTINIDSMGAPKTFNPEQR